MRTIAIGEPLSMARIGSASPVESARSIEPAVSCCASAALDWMNTRSGLRSSAAKYPCLIPMMTGQWVDETAPTMPTVIVSACASGDRMASSSVAAAVLSDRRMVMTPTPLFLGDLRAIVSRDLSAGRLPYPRVGADIGERRVEGVDPVWHAGEIGMQRDRHHASRFRPLAIEHIELPADHLAEFVGGAVRPLEYRL